MATKPSDGTAVAGVAWSASLRTLADRYNGRIAVRDGAGNTLTYRELCEQAHGLASYLVRVRGVVPGQPVATLLPNQALAVLASYALRLTGAAEVPVSWKGTDEEILWCASLSNAKLVMTLDPCVQRLTGLGWQPVAIDLDTALGSDEELLSVPGDLDGRILFTSGTTGKPKGVLYSHSRRWIGEQMLKASLPVVPDQGQKLILMTPFIHGSSLLTYAWCDLGGEVVLLDGVQEDRLRELLPDPSVVAVFAPPTVLAKITALFEGQTFSQVKCIFTGTQPLTPAIYARAKAMFGPVVRVTYGKSECVNPITVLSPQETDEYFSSDSVPAGACVGYPAPGVEIKIVAPSEDSELASEEDGEIWLRAPQMSLGMITSKGFSEHEPEGWHQTGDLGHIDSKGRLVLTGRIADVIKTGGYRVNPDEIESTLTGLGQQIQVSVTSLPSDYWGEVIIAVAENAFDGWQDLAKEQVTPLSRHKHPRAYVALDALPRNPQGKVSRRQVRDEVLRLYRLSDGPYPELVLI